MTEQNFQGKVALVTGSGFGLGRGSALAFAARGAKVVVDDINTVDGEQTVQMIKQAGGEAFFFKADVSSESEIKALVDSAVRTYGRLDFAHNNVGILDGTTLTETTTEQWNRVINSNLKGIWLCMKYELLFMAKQKSGVIINTSSVAGLIGCPGTSLYAASKWGVNGLTKSAAVEYAGSGIRVNAVCPAGMIGTGMYNQTFSKDPAFTAKLTSEVPIGKDTTPEQVAEVVVWLCSDAASYITGSIIPVDGGRSAV